MTMSGRLSLLAVCLVVAGASPVRAQAITNVVLYQTSVPENGTATFDVLVSGDPDASALLTVSATSGALAPAEAFTAMRVAPDRFRVVFRPPFEASGETNITFTLSDPNPLQAASLDGFDVVASVAKPRPPTDLTGTGSGQAGFTWIEPAAGSTSDMPSYYMLEVGDAPGLTAFAPIRIPARTSGWAMNLPRGGYNFRLRPGNRHGLGPVSAEGSVGLASGAGVPGPPAGLGATVSPTNMATVTWAAPGFGAAATQYVLEVGTASGLTNIGRFALPPTFSISAGVGPGTYVLRMRAVGAGGEGPASPEVFLTVPGGTCAPPSAPIMSTVLRNGPYLMVPWSAPATGQAENYALVAGTTPGASDIVVAPVGSSSSLFMLAPPPGTYHVFVQALSGCGAPASSNVVTYVEPAAGAPGAPRGLTATTGPGSVSFAWHPPVTGSRVDSYVLEAGDAPGAPTLSVPLTNMPGVGFTGLPSGGRYWVRVKAVNALGPSQPSNEISITIP